MTAGESRWNHNIHYHRVVREAIPPGARSGLDVGAGDGLLSADLARVVPDVTAVDRDDDVVRRGAAAHPNITWLRADVTEYDFGRQFDVVASVATLHHLPDLEQSLSRLATLVAPGGVLAIVGLARRDGPLDHLYGAIGAVQHRWYVRRRGYWEHSAPLVWPPEHSYREVREVARALLPGVQWSQYPMWRYALVWQRPTDQRGC